MPVDLVVAVFAGLKCCDLRPRWRDSVANPGSTPCPTGGVSRVVCQLTGLVAGLAPPFATL